MLVRGVVKHQVQNKADTAPVGFRHQPVEIRQGSEARVHIHVIADIVTEVFIGGRVKR